MTSFETALRGESEGEEKRKQREESLNGLHLSERERESGVRKWVMMMRIKVKRSIK